MGNEARDKRDSLTLRYPVSRGEIVNWDNIEKFWHHLFYNGTQTTLPRKQEKGGRTKGKRKVAQKGNEKENEKKVTRKIKRNGGKKCGERK